MRVFVPHLRKLPLPKREGLGEGEAESVLESRVNLLPAQCSPDLEILTRVSGGRAYERGGSVMGSRKILKNTIGFSMRQRSWQS